MTPLRASVAGAIASIILILVVVELVRGRRLKERYALLWLATGAVLLILSVWREGLNTLAGWFGVTGYPPAVLFAVATCSSSSCCSTTRPWSRGSRTRTSISRSGSRCSRSGCHVLRRTGLATRSPRRPTIRAAGT